MCFGISLQQLYHGVACSSFPPAATLALHHFLSGCSHCGICKAKSWHVLLFSAWWHCRMAKTQHVFCFLQTISMAKEKQVRLIL